MTLRSYGCRRSWGGARRAIDRAGGSEHGATFSACALSNGAVPESSKGREASCGQVRSFQVTVRFLHIGHSRSEASRSTENLPDAVGLLVKSMISIANPCSLVTFIDSIG